MHTGESFKLFDCDSIYVDPIFKVSTNMDSLDPSSRQFEEHYDEVVEYMMGMDFRNCFEVFWGLYPMYSSEAVMKDPAHLRKALHCD